MTEDMYDSAKVDKSQTHAKSAKKLQKLSQNAVKKWLISISKCSEE